MMLIWNVILLIVNMIFVRKYIGFLPQYVIPIIITVFAILFVVIFLTLVIYEKNKKF